MEPIKITYCYPDRTKEGREPGESSFIVSDSNIETIIGESNPIDCVCDTMKLVIMEKCDRKKLNEQTVSFFRDLNSFADFVNRTIINIFTQENELRYSSVEVNNILKEINSESAKLADSFFDVYNDCNKE